MNLNDNQSILNSRIANIAFGHLKNLNLREALLMESKGLIDNKMDFKNDEYLLNIIKNKSHEKRVNIKNGPFVIYKSDQDKKNYVLEIKELLLYTHLESRIVCCNYLEKLIENNHNSFSKSTTDLFSKYKKLITSINPDEWRSSSLKLYDKFENDILYQQFSLVQSIEERYEDGLQKYLPKILKIQTDTVELFYSEYKYIFSGVPELKSDFQQIIKNSKSISEALDTYLLKYSILPLYGDLSFPIFVKQLQNSNKYLNKNVNKALSAWSNNHKNPKAFLYLAFCLLTSEFNFSKTLSKKIENYIYDYLTDNFKDNRSKNYWTIYVRLAKYYYKYLDTQNLLNNPDHAAILSWWLSDMLSQLLIDDENAGKHLWDVAIEPVIQQVEIEWELVRPSPLIGKLPVYTTWNTSLWYYSLINSISKESSQYLNQNLSVRKKDKLNIGLFKNILYWEPIISKNDKYTFLFEPNIKDSLALWDFNQKKKNNSYIGSISNVYKEYLNDEKIISNLQSLEKHHQSDRLVIFSSFRILAITNNLNTEEILRILSDDYWRTNTFISLSVEDLELFLQSLIFLLQFNNEKYNLDLPHILSEICKLVVKDKDKLNVIFGYLIMVCIQTDTISSLSKLLTEDNKFFFLEIAQQWKQNIENISHASSAWSISKFRAINSAISASI